ncbi:MAG: site-2 protease family protein [Chloroflexi bacterium]|nr:site-2 protease family protein [Chloroflexota bacterium]
MESNETSDNFGTFQSSQNGNTAKPALISSERDEIITRAVGRVLKITSVTWGGQKQKYVARFVGRLYSEDTPAAYDKLAADLKPLEITPLFRWEGSDHAVILMPGVIKAKQSQSWVNLVLFILTLLSVLVTGGLYGSGEELPTGFWPLVLAFIQRGWPFAVSLIAILGAHEFGHYLAGRKHGLNVSLPYFIPMPFTSFGTMGAFINMREIPRNRRVLLDVGITGPLAGLVVAIPVLLLGLSLSEVSVLPVAAQPNAQLQMEGNSIIYLLAKYITFGKLLPQPANLNGASELLYWVKYFFTGQPFPYGGVDVMLHPVAWAGWAGLLVTGLNLIPVGQLDGGHVINVLLGPKWSKRIYPIIMVAMFGMGFFWNGWWLWGAILLLLGRMVAEPLDMITPLDNKRKALAILGLVVFVLTITPVPLILI